MEAEREQRQRDYDKKLLLAKSKIENVQVRIHRSSAGPLKEMPYSINLSGVLNAVKYSLSVHLKGKSEV